MFVLVPCTKPGCQKKHGVISVKRQHAKYEGPETSPLRVPDEDPALPLRWGPHLESSPAPSPDPSS